MAFTDETLRPLVRRLRTLPQGNNDCPWETLAEELLRVLWIASDDLEHAERIVEACILRQWRPTPAELREVAEGVVSLSSSDLHGPLPDCPDCAGSGWRSVERGGFTGVVACPCDTRRAAAVKKIQEDSAREQQRTNELREKRSVGASRAGDQLAKARSMR